MYPTAAGVDHGSRPNPLSPFYDNNLEGYRNATKTCRGVWDREEEEEGSLTPPVSALLATGIAATNAGRLPHCVAAEIKAKGCRDAFESEI